MSYSPTAQMLNEAIENSPLTQAEIAKRAGFPNPNVLSMMKNGLTKVPLARIPMLADALEIDRTPFIECALEEYYPEVHDVLTEMLGFPLTPDEEELVGIYRMACLDEEIPLEGPLRAALENLFDVASAARE